MKKDNEIDRIYKVFEVLNLAIDENLRIFKEMNEAIIVINKRLTSLEIEVQSLLDDDEA